MKGSFSTVSKPTFASKCSSSRIFQALITRFARNCTTLSSEVQQNFAKLVANKISLFCKTNQIEFRSFPHGFWLNIWSCRNFMQFDDHYVSNVAFAIFRENVSWQLIIPSRKTLLGNYSLPRLRPDPFFRSRAPGGASSWTSATTASPMRPCGTSQAACRPRRPKSAGGRWSAPIWDRVPPRARPWKSLDRIP